MSGSRLPSRLRPPPLWLCLYCHALPLDQLGATGKLLAIVEKQRIAFASEAAQAAGIYPDMRLATAYALQPDITIVERQPNQEAQALDELTEWAYQFSPTVCSYKDFCVLLDIGGSLTLFKGISRLLRQIEQGLKQRGFQHSKGLAHTPEAAWMLSHYRADYDAPLAPGEMNEFSPPETAFWLPALRALPLNYLDISGKQQQQLFNMGLHSLGELLDLPRAELGKRFGRELLNQLAAITGEKPSLAADFQPARTFNAQIDFANGLSKIDELQGPMEELLGELMRFLQQHQLYTRLLQWQFFYFRQPGDRLLIHSSAANNNLASLLSLSKLKLEQFQLKAPLESLALHSDCFTAAATSSRDLFPELSHPSNQLKDYRQLLDKLLTRLGSESLQTLQLGDEHLPEYQQVLKQLDHRQLEELRLSPGIALPETQSMLPLWLNKEPQPIAAPNASAGPLRLIYGPQRIDSHWWQERRQRDYFIARHQNGSYCWVFKDLRNQRWFLQGFYA